MFKWKTQHGYNNRKKGTITFTISSVRENERRKQIKEIDYIDHDHKYKSILPFGFYLSRHRNWVCNIDECTITCSWRYVILFGSLFQMFFSDYLYLKFVYVFFLVFFVVVSWMWLTTYLYKKQHQFWEAHWLEKYNLLICINS